MKSVRETNLSLDDGTRKLKESRRKRRRKKINRTSNYCAEKETLLFLNYQKIIDSGGKAPKRYT